MNASLPPAAPTVVLVLRWLLFVGVVLTPGCAPPATGPGSLRPLELVTEGDPPPAPEVVLQVSPRLEAGWTVEGAAARALTIDADDGPRSALGVPEGRDFAVHGPLEADPTDSTRSAPRFERVALGVRSPKTGVSREVVLTLRLPAAGAADTTWVSKAAALKPAQGTQWLVFDFPELRRAPSAPTHVTIRVGGQKGPFALERVDLIAVSPRAFLPHPLDSPALIHAGRDGRRGYGLGVGADLVGGAVVPEGAALVFSYTVPAELVLPGAPSPALVVTLEGPSGRESKRFELLFDAADASQTRWRVGRVPVTSRGGESLRVRFSLDAGGRADRVCAVAEPALVRRGSAAPSVLLITSDTHRGDHLGAARLGIEVATPALDALARRGVLFERGFATTNITNPSHVALFTGTHPRDTRIVDNRHALAGGATTLAEHFRDAGYVTWATVSARHLAPKNSGLGQGFTRYAVPNDIFHDATDAVDQLAAWLPDADGLPLFCWVHLFDAHHPYGPPAPFDRHYYPRDKDPFDPALPDPRIPKKVFPYDLVGLRDVEFPLAQYRAEVAYLDRQLERVLADSHFADGVVALTGDHGESLGQHGIWYSHGGLYPDSLHVPLILAWPGGPRGTRVSRTVSHLGLGRTLLELADIATSASFPGTSLAAELDDGTRAEGPIFALAERGTIASVTSGGWHLILHLRNHHRRESAVRKERYQVELFDLERDRACEQDLVAVERERARSLCETLVAWLRAQSSTGFVGDPLDSAATMRGLAALGYADNADPEPPREVWIDPTFDCASCEALQ